MMLTMQLKIIINSIENLKQMLVQKFKKILYLKMLIVPFQEIIFPCATIFVSKIHTLGRYVQWNIDLIEVK